MGLTGDPSYWLDTFPDALVPDILDLIVSVWVGFTKPIPDENEVPITRRFRHALMKDKNLRKSVPVRIGRESVEDDLHTGEEIGRIDLCFTSPERCREDVYFAFECKKLNVVYNGQRKTLATEYVTHGMMRFITSQYASNLALEHGGMIGYVMDSDVGSAISAVDRSIKRYSNELGISPQGGLMLSSIRPNNNKIKETRHKHENRSLVLHHLFLAC